MLLVRSYRTFAPLLVEANGLPLAVCFCGTLLTVTRTGRYPASLAFREPGLSSKIVKGKPLAIFATTEPALYFLVYWTVGCLSLLSHIFLADAPQPIALSIGAKIS